MHNVSAAHAVAQIKRRKEVEQLNMDGNYIATFPSLRDASKATVQVQMKTR